MQVILLPFHLYFYFILIFGPCFLKTDSSPHFFLVIFTLVSFWNYDKRTWVHAVRRVTAETPENAKHSTWARTQVRKKSHVKRTHHQSLVGPYAFPFTPSYCCCPLAQQWSWTRWRGFVAPCRPIEKEARSLHSSQRWVECDDSLWVMAVSNKFVIFYFKNWVLMQRLVLGLNAKWIILKFFFCIMWGGVRASNVKPPDFFKGTIRNCALWNSHHIAWVSHIPVLYSLSQSCFVWLDLFSRMCSWIVYTQNAHCQIYLMCQHKFWLILFFFLLPLLMKTFWRLV